MQRNLNDEIPQEKLASAIQGARWDELSTLRLYEGNPGDVCYVDKLDLSARKLGDMPTDFLCLRACSLVNASLAGKHFFPLSLWSCDARNIDLRHTSGMLFAYDTDLRGVQFDATTRLVVDNSDLPSAFKDCLMDDDFREFLLAQGVLLDFPLERSIENYAFNTSSSRLHSSLTS
jgi:hypothetical protein